MAEENTEKDDQVGAEQSDTTDASQDDAPADESTPEEVASDKEETVNQTEQSDDTDRSDVVPSPDNTSIGNEIPVVEPTKVTSADGSENIEPITDISMLLDIPVTLSMEIGQTKISISELLKLGKDSVIELQRLAHEPLDVLVNGTLIAHGEAVVVGDRFGIRLIDVISPQERLRNFG